MTVKDWGGVCGPNVRKLQTTSDKSLLCRCTQTSDELHDWAVLMVPAISVHTRYQLQFDKAAGDIFCYCPIKVFCHPSWKTGFIITRFLGKRIQYLLAASALFFSWRWPLKTKKKRKKEGGESTSFLLSDKHHSSQHSCSPIGLSSAAGASRRPCWWLLVALWRRWWGQCARTCCRVWSEPYAAVVFAQTQNNN